MTTKNAIESCFISTPDGTTLHVRVFKPTQETTQNNSPVDARVLVHPYSKLGGSQALMHGIALRLSIKGFTAITFDLRGVGRSTGCNHSRCHGCLYLGLSKLAANKILLVGSSAGAPIAGSAVDKLEEIIGYVSIGYPFGLTASILFGRHHKAILQSPKPKLFVMGTRDGFTSVGQLENKLKSAVGRAETHLIEGVSHFEMEGPNYDARVVDLILSFLASLKGSTA